MGVFAKFLQIATAGRIMMRALCVMALACFVVHAAMCFVGPSNPVVLKTAPSAVSGSSLDEPALDTQREISSHVAWNPLALGLALGLLAAVAGSRPVMAADLENGEAIFGANCAACHAGGNNSVVAEKKIKIEAIKTQVTNGKNNMPAFGEKLGPDDIEDVASWVYDHANGTEEARSGVNVIAFFSD